MSSASYADCQALGQELYAKGDFVAAVEQFRQATNINPALVQGWRSLGFALHAAGDGAEALKTFRTAIALDPENPDSQFGFGLAGVAVGEYSDAIKAFDEALRIKPNHSAAKQALVTALVGRGKEYLRSDEAWLAEQDLERAHKLDRHSPDSLAALADYYLEHGQKAKVVKLADQAAQDQPDNAVTKKLQQQIASDPSYRGAVAAHAVQAPKPTGPAPKPAPQHPDQVPCPNCKSPVMPWASVCPVCNFQIKAMPSSFTGRGPATTVTWQEIVYYIMASLWALQAVLWLLAGYITSQSGVLAGLGQWTLGIGIVLAAVSIGLFTQSTLAQFLAKIFCWLLIIGGCGLVLNGMLSGLVVLLGMGVFYIGIASFQIYILKTVGDV